KAQHVIKARLEFLQEIFDFTGRLLLWILFALDLRSFLTPVNGDRPVLWSAELGPLHVGELDVVGKQIAAAKFAASESKEAAGGVDVFDVKDRLTAEGLDHLINRLVRARLGVNCHHESTKTQSHNKDCTVETGFSRPVPGEADACVMPLCHCVFVVIHNA